MGYTPPRRHRYISLLFLLILMPATMQAQQTGGIRGRITDREFNVSLTAAMIRIAETGKKTKTDEQGHFAIQGLKPGSYTIVISKEGYQRVVQSDVVVTAGSMTDVSTTLPGEYVDMERVVVRPLKLGGSSDIALLNLRAQNLGIMDAVGSELMSMTGAGSAADAMQLVSGATVEEGKYAVIRGLSDRFVNTRMNGVALPTADPDVRAVQLDLFPSALLQSVRVHKTFSPDLPANTSGGMVNIVTKKLPEGRILKLDFGTSYNTQATGNEDFLTYDAGGVDYWGTDKAPRSKPVESGKVPDPVGPRKNWKPGEEQNLPAPNWKSFFPEPATVEEQKQMDELDRITRSFNSTIGSSRKTAPANHSWKITYGDRLKLGSESAIGWLGTMSYKNSFSYFDGAIDRQKAGKKDLSGYQTPEGASGEPDDLYPDQWKKEKGTETVQWGFGGLIGVEKQQHKLSLSYIRTLKTTDETTILLDDQTRADVPNKYFWHNQSLDYTKRTLESLQLRGEHPLSFVPQGEAWGVLWKEPKVDWSLASNESVQDQPDRRFFLAKYTPAHRGPGGNWSEPGSVFPHFAERAWREITEENQYADFNLAWPFELIEDEEGEIKMGYSANETDRTYSQDTFYYTPPGGTTPFRQHGDSGVGFNNLWTEVFLESQRLGYPAEATPDTAYQGSGKEYSGNFTGTTVDSTSNEANWVIQDFFNDVDYSGKLTIDARYAMTDLPVTPWLTLTGGARWTKTSITTDVDAAAEGQDQNVHVLGVRQDPVHPSPTTAKSINEDPGNNISDMTLDKLANTSIERTDVLPMVGVTIEPWEKLKLRGVYSQTIGRPTFKEITPVSQQDHLSGQQFAGNPDLQVSELTNYDLRLEWMPAEGQLLSAGVFYKEIVKPIDYSQRETSTGQTYIIPFNFEDGEVKGIELEARQPLGRCGEWLNNVSGHQWFSWLEDVTVGGNLTFLDATVGLPQREVQELKGLFNNVENKAAGDYELERRQMKDQPEYIASLYLLYKDKQNGTSAGLFWNRKGETLIAGEYPAANNYFPNLISMPHNSLNMTLSQKLWNNWKISLKAENILNPKIEQVWRSDYIPGEITAESYQKGVTYSISVSAKW